MYSQLYFVLLGILSAFFVFRECKQLDGYKFPVYSTEFCPRNDTEWKERAFVLNCTLDNGYTCLPNSKFTELLEFCYTQPRILIEKGACLYLYKPVSKVNAHNCRHFEYGCPNSSYLSTKIFQVPACIQIGNGCFLAEPSCISKSTHPSPTTTFTHWDSFWIWVSPIIGVCFSICSLCGLMCILRIYRRKNGVL